jgi:hypothetical protein
LEKRTKLVATTIALILVAVLVIALAFFGTGKEHEEGAAEQLNILANGVCEDILGNIFRCHMFINPGQGILVEKITIRVGNETVVVKPSTPIMLEKGTMVEYFSSSDRGVLTITKPGSASILRFYAERIVPSTSMCSSIERVLDEKVNLSTGTAFPFERKIQPSLGEAFFARLILKGTKQGGLNSLASVDVKLFMLQDTLAWEFYDSEPAPLLRTTYTIPMGGVPGEDAYYTKLTILYSAIGPTAPKEMRGELLVYKTAPVQVYLRLTSGEVVTIVLPLVCY